MSIIKDNNKIMVTAHVVMTGSMGLFIVNTLEFLLRPSPMAGKNPWMEAINRALENLKNSSASEGYPDDWSITDNEYYNKYNPNSPITLGDPFDPKILEDYRNVDPIVLDLNRDGIDTVGMNSFAYFDYDGNGFAEKTGWLAGGNGLLVQDRDANGIIDAGKELFGDQTLLANGNKATNGFQALAELDTNIDGKIDINDSAWLQLQVWADNGDGLSEANELKTLYELGIESLSLNKVAVNTVDEQGNTKLNSSTFKWSDGTNSEMSDYIFQTNRVESISTNMVEVSEDIQEMAYLPGYGNVEDSWQIMMKEADGRLKGLLESYVGETDVNTRSAILDQILYTMAGSMNIDPNSRGENINAQKLAVVEKIYTNQFNNGASPNTWVAPLLNSVYENLKKYYSGWLTLQLDESELFSQIGFTFDETKEKLNVDFSKVKEIIENRLNADFENGKKSLGNFINGLWAIGMSKTEEFNVLCQEFISQSDELALVIYSAGRNIRNGSRYNDKLYAEGSNEILLGGIGNDVLEAHGEDVILSGGTGDDGLYGCKGASEYRWGQGASDGNVTYLWNKGDGNDIIINAVAINNSSNAGFSQIKLGVGITLNDLVFKQERDSVLIINKTNGEVLTIKDWFVDDDYKIDFIKFSNGDQLLRSEIQSLISFGETAGDDKLIGGSSNDILDGGLGSDYLEGGAGDDTYIWGRGYGNDTINNEVLHYGTSGSLIEGGADKLQLTEGLTASDLIWRTEDNNLTITIKDTGEKLILIDWYKDRLNMLDSINFADGTILTASEINDLTKTIEGTESDDIIRGGDTQDNIIKGNSGNDKLYGNGGNDILDGGAGSDYLEGGAGNDAYIWGRGYGNDTINNEVLYYETWGSPIDGGEDVLQLTEGLILDDIAFGTEGNNLTMTIKDTGEKLVLIDWYKDGFNMLDSIHFADGATLTASEINELAKTIAGTEGADTLYGGDTKDDIIKGNSGDDKLYGNKGNDTLDGGSGNDYLEGGVGDDTYIWGRGYGNDTIHNEVLYYETFGNTIEGGADKLQLTEGITANDITWRSADNNLIATIKDTGETLTFINWYKDQLNMLDSVHFTDGTILTASEINDLTKTIEGTDSDDVIRGGDTQDNIIKGGSGNDKLYGNGGNDNISGGIGNDELYGGLGNDILDGEVGNDYLEGGVGNDTYIWGRGYGKDTINNEILYYGTSGNPIDGGVDKLQFKEEITANDITWRSTDNNLIATIKDTGETLTFTSWYKDPLNMLDSVHFADGTILTASEINDLTKTIEGTDGDDVICGGDTQDDIIQGNSGNDKLYGNKGNDILDGGAGNDYLEGGAGDDTYIWGRGYGNDTIHNEILYYGTSGNPIEGGADKLQLKEGIIADDITWRSAGNNLILTIKDTGETLTFTNWFVDPLNQLDSIHFVDGTILTASEINELAKTIAGTEGADTLYGGDTKDDIIKGNSGDDKLYGNKGNDTLDGGSGNDYLEGGVGNDTYIWGRGYGNDTIHNEILYYGTSGSPIDGGVDVLQLIEGLSLDDIVFGTEGNNLTMTIKDTGEKLVLIDWYKDAFNMLDSVNFVDGRRLSASEINELAKTIAGTEGVDTLYGGDAKDDVIKGNGGDDKLYGNKGNDILDGGAGNDYLEGGAGDDAYIWGRGYGNDTINNVVLDSWRDPIEGGADKLRLKEGITADDITWRSAGNNLILAIKDTGETLTFTNWFANPLNQLDSVSFADGTILIASDINELAKIIAGTEDTDDLYGGDAKDDIIEGNGGDDKLYGNKGNDILDGGAGNDYLEGGAGDDAYIWGRGYGNDTINNVVLDSWRDPIEGGADKLRLKEGITADDITWRSAGNNLILAIKDTGETLTFTNWFANPLNQLDSVSFADGTILTASDINELAKIIAGTEATDDLYGGDAKDDIIEGNGGDDKLYGNKGNDILDGGAGNDYLEGGAGDDAYIWGRGYGNDTINNVVLDSWRDPIEGGADKLRLKEGTTADDITWRSAGNNLIATIKDTGETLTFANWFANPLNQLDSVHFVDGTILTASEINELAKIIAGTEDTDDLYGGDAKDDIIEGNGGDDKLYGNKGNDILDGGAGNDYLEGGAGDDAYIWGRGYGNDTINNVVLDVWRDPIEGGADKLQINAGLSAGDLTWSKDGNNLIATINDTSETLVFTDWYANKFNRLDSVNFADGTILTADELEALVPQPVAACAAFMSSMPETMGTTGYQIDTADSSLQQIAYATIAFDGEHGGLGCGLSDPMAGNATPEGQTLSFTDSGSNDGYATGETWQTTKRSNIA